MVVVVMGQEEVGVGRDATRPQGFSEGAGPRAEVKDEEAPRAPELHAGRISTVAPRLGARSWDGTADAPEGDRKERG